MQTSAKSRGDSRLDDLPQIHSTFFPPFSDSDRSDQEPAQLSAAIQDEAEADLTGDAVEAAAFGAAPQPFEMPDSFSVAPDTGSGTFVPDRGRGGIAEEQSPMAEGEGGALQSAPADLPPAANGSAHSQVTTLLDGLDVPPQAEQGLERAHTALSDTAVAEVGSRRTPFSELANAGADAALDGAGSRRVPVSDFAHADKAAGADGALAAGDLSAEVAGASFGGIAGPEPMWIPNDPDLSRQWHIENGSRYDINVTAVWDDYTGSGVLVGVVDDGIDYQHGDLDANYNFAADYDARSHDSDAYASDPADRHGTAVAGTIAAEADNGYGGSGVAPEAEIAGFRIGYGQNGSTSQVADALQQQVNVDISNNSWKYGGYFTDNFLSSGFASSAQAIEDAVTYGRDGLGTVFVFSGGNGGLTGDDVNYHNFQNSQYTIAVGALESDGSVANFSNPGAALLVSAPGLNVYTTDRPGSLGYSGGDFVSASGTSFSAPVVSGVIALMLEANPNLGYRDVQEILAYSAIKPVSSDAGWQENGATNWNGGGLTVSHEYGFGAVDALAAVRLAETWTAQSTMANLESISANSSPRTYLGDNTTISDTITIDSSNLVVDHVEVLLDLSHTFVGQLVVTLTSPDGTTSVLVNQPGEGTASQDNIRFTLDSVQFWGESGEGTWTLSVTDTGSGYTGQLNSWTLSLYGDATIGNDTYFYNDEYSVIADPDRQILIDNEGTDAINTSAVTTDVVLDLTPGGTSLLDGTSLFMGQGTVIENAYLGDGNDVVYGNDADNMILGGRGDDTLYGGIGFDTALYFGALDSYLVSEDASGAVSVTYFDGSVGIDDGSDLLFDFEALSFSGEIYFISDLLGTDPNSPPTATDDVVSVAEDGSLTVDVLANDSDPDGDSLTLSLASQPDHGQVTLNPDGTFTYTPDPNFNGADSFRYQIDDGRGGTTTATVAVTVSPVNDAPLAADDQAITGEGAPVTIDVLSNDGDVDGDALSAAVDSGPSHGTVVSNPDGTFTYTPDAGFTGSDSFTYIASDGAGGVDLATVAITVTRTNAAPIALDDAVATAEDTAVVIDALANDSDDDGDALSPTISSGPQHGSVVVNADGTFSYAPDGNYNGSDSFTYSVSDGQGGSDSATVSITVDPVNDAPIAVDDSAVAIANADALDQAAGVTIDALANDMDPDGDPLTASLTTNAAHGTVVANADGTFTYIPDAGFMGSDSFEYSVADGSGGTDTATVTVDVSEPNAISGTDGDDVLRGSAGPEHIYGRDGDDRIYGNGGNDLLDGGAGADLVVGGSEADVLIGGLGADTLYGRGGNDVFRYRDLADAGDEIRDFRIGEDVLDLSAVLASLGYSGNDPVADGVLQQVYSRASRGLEIWLDPDGPAGLEDAVLLATLRGIREPLQVGQDILIATGSQPPAGDPPAGDPPASTPPSVVDDAVQTDEDRAVVFDPLANDSDADGDPFFVASLGTAAHGAVELNADGTVTYTPEADFFGSDTFEYTVSDDTGAFSTGTVAVTVDPVNDAPTARDDTASTSEGTPVWIDVLANDSDVDGDSLTVAIETAASHGNVVVDADGGITYTPGAGFTGAESFTYALLDNQGGRDVATVTVNVGNANTILGTESDDVLAGTTGADHILGNGGDDRLYGRDGNDILDGGSGADRLVAGGGNDVLIGGAGADTLYGQAGSDVFKYGSIDDAGDRIADFTPGEDVLDLRDLLSDVEYDSLDEVLSQALDPGTDTVTIAVDPDGAAGPAGFESLVDLSNLGSLLDTSEDIYL